MSSVLLLVLSRLVFAHRPTILASHVLFVEDESHLGSVILLSHLLTLFYIVAHGLPFLLSMAGLRCVWLFHLSVSLLKQIPSAPVFSSFTFHWSAFDLLPQIEREPYFINFWISGTGHNPLNLAGVQSMLVGIKCNILKKVENALLQSSFFCINISHKETFQVQMDE